MRFLWFLLFISSAFADCKPVSVPFKLTPGKGLTVTLNQDLFRLTGLTFLKNDDFKIASAWLSELSEARHGSITGVDRYGANIAPLFHGEELISAAFLRVGIAMANDEAGDCSALLKAAELEAIKGNKGLWSSILIATDPKLNDFIGQYIAVRGRVISARKGRSGVFINFSYDFKTSLSGFIFEKDIEAIAWRELSGKSVILKGIVSKNPNLQMIISKSTQVILE